MKTYTQLQLAAIASYKYERDDGDIARVKVRPEIAGFAGVVAQPSGAPNDLDTVGAPGTGRKTRGTRCRFATFKGVSRAVGSDGIERKTSHRVLVPVMTKAAYGVTPFVPGAKASGFLLRINENNELKSIAVEWECESLTPEKNR